MADLQYISVFKNITSKNGTTILPENIMMYMKDKAMSLADNGTSKKLFEMDIEKGKVIEEWSTSENNIVRNGPTKEYNQLINEQNILGLSITPYLNRNIHVLIMKIKLYKSKVENI